MRWPFGCGIAAAASAPPTAPTAPAPPSRSKSRWSDEPREGKCRPIPISRNRSREGEPALPVRALRGGNGTLLFYGGAACFLSLIHISEPTRQAEISYAVFCL